VGRISQHFSTSEFTCKDGCGWSTVDPSLVDLLERVRALKKRPVRIVSGRRCPPHNVAVGGSLRSRHVHGDGVDIPADLRLTKAEALRVGFTGIGVNLMGYVTHVDIRPLKGHGPIVWRY
jgi:uncharacterized protein YcbK (DUF882 family)